MGIAKALPRSLIGFIERQPLFFVATAARDGRVNLSPKGMDTLRVLGPDRIRWLNLSGSGNETAAHLIAAPEPNEDSLLATLQSAIAPGAKI